MSFTLTFAIVAVSVFLLTVAVEYKLIPVLRSHKAGQKILEIGPRWHKDKEDTPTMGGIGFILAAMTVIAVYFIVCAVRGVSANYIPLALTLAFAVANGSIGFLDDYCKLIKKQNQGLTWIQKLVLQLVIAAAYVAVMSYTGHMDTVLKLPFSDRAWDMGLLWYPFAVIVLAGVVNGANITDGLDGLASMVTFVIGGFFTLLAFTLRDEQLSLVGAILLGTTLGFLIFNYHPAKVFMGDTGSLFLGALVIAAAFQIDQSIVGLLVAGVFILEAFSSFLQTTVYKITKRNGVGKRLFRMAPLHHHFEKCGWEEEPIVWVFSAAELLFCILAWFAL